MRLLIAIVAVAAAGCFSPAERDGVVACSASGACPPDFTCAADNFCYRSPPGGIDAASIDASLVDGGAPPDASLIDSGFQPECSDGEDNDCDGAFDFPADPGCLSANDPNEHGTKECDDGIDNDADNATDFHFGAGCATSDPQCSGPDDPKEDI